MISTYTLFLMKTGLEVPSDRSVRLMKKELTRKKMAVPVAPRLMALKLYDTRSNRFKTG